jgi:heme A synthase
MRAMAPRLASVATDPTELHVPSSSGSAVTSFRRITWGVLAYTVLVILFGAVVRITGSGAGCGQHWPTCQGEVVPLPSGMEMAIELSHRISSGISFLFVVGLTVLASRRFAAGHPARRATYVAMACMVIEALIGAALVLFGLTGNNDSVARAVVMALHLLSTCFLTAGLVLAGFWATRRPDRCLRRSKVFGWLLLTLALVLAVSATGAVTALGDTLYPVTATTSSDRVAADQELRAHFLERLRGLHPVLAFVVAGFVITVVLRSAGTDSRASPSLARLVVALVVLQLGLGLLNIWLSAPGFMQVIHLAAAMALWITLVLLTARALEEPQKTLPA